MILTIPCDICLKYFQAHVGEFQKECKVCSKCKGIYKDMESVGRPNREELELRKRECWLWEL